MSGWVAGTPDSEGGGRFIEPWRRGGEGEEGVAVVELIVVLASK
jgi:hypothetical protein